MKKKLILGIVFSVLPVFLCLAYFLVARYYGEKFTLNTWINGVYCTGKTVDEVNAELLSEIKAPIVIVTDETGNEYSFDMADMKYQMDYKASLEGFLEEQNPYLWIRNVAIHQKHEVMPVISYDQSMLRESFFALEPVADAVAREEDYQLWYSQEDGYQLYDGLTHRFDAEKTFDKLLAALEAGETRFYFEEDFYYDVPLTERQQYMQKVWEKLEAYYQCDIVYDMGAEQITFSTSVLSDFLLSGNGIPLLDANDNLILNEESVEAFVADLASRYDTYKKERSFQSTRGDVITLKKGTYGTQLDQKSEIRFLIENLMTAVSQVHVPAYLRQAYTRGLDDIGDTYIEIDITDQKLYCYVDGKVAIETDIVTGNKRRGMSTPEGIYYVYAKQTDRILRGEGYASPVDYWMPVNGGIGIHDADWRKKFGGEIYKTNGSHGCINVPPEIMPQIYEMMEIGTPVIIFN